MTDCQWPAVGITLQRLGDTLQLQPFEPSQEQLPTLHLDLRSGTMEMAQGQRIARSCRVVPGVMGVIKLSKITALITIEEAKQVATFHEARVFEIIRTDVKVPHGEISEEDAEFVELLKAAVDPDRFGTGLYFSYRTNLTLTTERLAAVERSSTGSWSMEDPRFFWNQHLCKPLIQCKAHAFILPVIQGFVSEVKELDFAGRDNRMLTGELLLVARRSVRRLGTRHWRRGADKQGSVANHVETEQLVTFSNGHSCSFVQMRGSIPVFWTSIPNVGYKPPTVVAKEFDYIRAFEAHVGDLLDTYKECVAVNLAHKTGSEGRLTKAFDDAAKRFSRTKEGFRLINFDFHKECGTTRYHRLSILFDQIRSDLDRFGQFTMVDGRASSVQKGIVRTNCVDCLDRTNVVQTVFSRYALESFLKQSNLLADHHTLPSAFPEIESKFKVLWADHGDEVSRQYSGTGALKSGFTRTGKRSIGGLIDDGIKSIHRYYLNNFEDGWKQDALDLISGTFTVGHDPVSVDLQRHPDILIYTVLFLTVYGVSKILAGLLDVGHLLKNFYWACLCFLSVIFIVKFLMIRNGSQLICKPKLRPDLPKQW